MATNQNVLLGKSRYVSRAGAERRHAFAFNRSTASIMSRSQLLLLFSVWQLALPTVSAVSTTSQMEFTSSVSDFQKCDVTIDPESEACQCPCGSDLIKIEFQFKGAQKCLAEPPPAQSSSTQPSATSLAPNQISGLWLWLDAGDLNGDSVDDVTGSGPGATPYKKGPALEGQILEWAGSIVSRYDNVLTLKNELGVGFRHEPVDPHGPREQQK